MTEEAPYDYHINYHEGLVWALNWFWAGFGLGSGLNSFVFSFGVSFCGYFISCSLTFLVSVSFVDPGNVCLSCSTRSSSKSSSLKTNLMKHFDFGATSSSVPVNTSLDIIIWQILRFYQFMFPIKLRAGLFDIDCELLRIKPFTYLYFRVNRFSSSGGWMEYGAFSLWMIRDLTQPNKNESQ